MNGDLAREILARVKRCLPAGVSHVLHEPLFGGTEQQYLEQCIDSGWVSTGGKFVDAFEARLAEVTGARYVIATVNGTAALHACLLVAGVAAEDEVIVPTLTFVATANAVSYCRAIPHFADSSEETLGLDAPKLEAHLAQIARVKDGVCRNHQTGRRIRALVLVHTFGHPADLDALDRVCARFGLLLIEDAAEALGSRYSNQHVGNRGLVSALSFNGNKIVTTGGGGAALTNSSEIAAAARHLTTTARTASKWEFIHTAVGYNYRLPNLNAALGLAQLEQLEDFLRRKRMLAARYRDEFAGLDGVRVFRPSEFTDSNYWLNTLLLERADEVGRDAVLELLNDNGIGARPVWRLMHRLPMYRDCPRMDLATAESLERRIINVPSSAFLASG